MRAESIQPFGYSDAADLAKSQAPEGTAELRMLEMYTLDHSGLRCGWNSVSRVATEWLFEFVPARPDLTHRAVMDSIGDCVTEFIDSNIPYADALQNIREIIADAEVNLH